MSLGEAGEPATSVESPLRYGPVLALARERQHWASWPYQPGTVVVCSFPELSTTSIDTAPGWVMM